MNWIIYRMFFSNTKIGTHGYRAATSTGVTMTKIPNAAAASITTGFPRIQITIYMWSNMLNQILVYWKTSRALSLIHLKLDHVIFFNIHKWFRLFFSVLAGLINLYSDKISNNSIGNQTGYDNSAFIEDRGYSFGSVLRYAPVSLGGLRKIFIYLILCSQNVWFSTLED